MTINVKVYIHWINNCVYGAFPNVQHYERFLFVAVVVVVVAVCGVVVIGGGVVIGAVAVRLHLVVGNLCCNMN